MQLDSLLQRTLRRLSEFYQSHRADIVLEEFALTEAVELWEAAQPADVDHLTLEEDQQLRAARIVIGTLYFLRFAVLHTKDLSEFARAIVFLAPLVEDSGIIPAELHIVLGPTADVSVQASFGADLLNHALTTTDPMLIEASVLLLSFAVATAAPNHPYRRGMFSNLGNAYLQRFNYTGARTDLECAIEAAKQAVAAAGDNVPSPPMLLNNLGLAYRELHQLAGVRGDLERAIDASERAVAAADAGDPNQAMFLSNLGLAYHERFEVAGSLADLQRAVEIGERAVAATPEGDPNRGAYLSNAGIAYREQFLNSGILVDLECAIGLLEQAVAATPHGPRRCNYLTNLSLIYQARYERVEMLADLQRAIEIGEQAVAATPEAHPDRGAYLSNVGIAYSKRYERVGTLADLQCAIDLMEQAVAATPDDHLSRPVKMSNLSDLYQKRYRCVGRLADLQRAIELGEQVVAAVSGDNPQRAEYLASLGFAYRMRCERIGTLADLQHAVDLIEQAITVTPNDHLKRAEYVSTLGFTYLKRFEHSHAPADLDRAIDLMEQAIAVIPENHPHRAGHASDLAFAYKTRFEQACAPTDLELAIQLINEAMAATPKAHPVWTQYLINLGQAYHAGFNADGRRVEQEILLALAQQATQEITASPRANASARWAVGSLAHVMNDNHTAVALLDSAVALLPSVAPRESGWADQEHRLGEHLGLVCDAVAAHCAINDPVGAIEVAESGRGILLSSHLDSRTELVELEHAHPGLAAQFRQIREQLSTPDSVPVESAVDAVRRVETRNQNWAQHDALLAQIRQQVNFARFLCPPRFEELQPAVADGTAVLVNAGRCHGDAIIITSDADPVLVTLPDVALTDVATYTALLLDADNTESSLTGPGQRQRVLPEILSWLWTSIVDPILNALPAQVSSQEPLPRVWWLPTGRLGMFPLHAAGHPGQPGALDAVVSSYAPTLRVLAHSRSQPAATHRCQLVVALEHTPGLPNLPGTVMEAAELHSQHPDTPALIDHDATIHRVLSALPDISWAHFACHASTNLTAPSQGGLRLHDGTLPIADISRLRLAHAELAYLSACSTAHRGLRHADESIHLASAFQLAGFRHVVASLWPLDDHIAVTAARAFYDRLPPTPTAKHAAIVLHHITLQLRAMHPNRPDLWAPLIHNGP